MKKTIGYLIAVIGFILFNYFLLRISHFNFKALLFAYWITILIVGWIALVIDLISSED